MTREEAVETLKAHYPDACYEQLREAVDTAIEALKAQDTAGDTIYRKVAIDAVQGIGRLATLQDNDAVVRMSAVEYVLFNLPSAQPEPPEPEELDFVQPHKKIGVRLEIGQPEIIRCKDCKFYTPMNRETKTGICRLLMHQNFGDDWYCAGAERRTDCVRAFTDMYEEERDD